MRVVVSGLAFAWMLGGVAYGQGKARPGDEVAVKEVDSRPEPYRLTDGRMLRFERDVALTTDVNNEYKPAGAGTWTMVGGIVVQTDASGKVLEIRAADGKTTAKSPPDAEVAFREFNRPVPKIQLKAK